MLNWNSLKQSPFTQLNINLKTAEEVYRAAVYGALHNETQIIQILAKTGLESANKILQADKFKKAIQALNAISEKEKGVYIDLTKRELGFIRSSLKIQLQVVKNVPKLAREQLLITYAILVEGYVNDIIRSYLKQIPNSLKSNKSTLKDYQLVDSIIEGNTLEKLVDLRVRELMYDSISGWIDFLIDRGFRINQEKSLKEMFLLRNVIIHNNKKVGIELSKEIGGRRYSLGKGVDITNHDIKRFRAVIYKTTAKIDSEYNNKLKPILKRTI